MGDQRGLIMKVIWELEGPGRARFDMWNVTVKGVKEEDVVFNVVATNVATADVVADTAPVSTSMLCTFPLVCVKK